MSSIYDTGKGSIYNESDEFMAGQIAHCASGVIPVGWLECNGAAISRATYGTLFAAIGTNYGPGDGATTFNLPDLRGEFVRGADRGRGIDPGRAVGSLQLSQNKAHEHGIGMREGSSGDSDGVAGVSAGGVGSNLLYVSRTRPEGGGEARPRSVALIAVIKYS